MKNVFTYCLLLVSLGGWAQDSHLAGSVSNLIADPYLQHGTLGFILYDLDSSKTLLAENEEKSLIPASTLKLVTTATALEVLRADYTFKTTLGYTGSIADSILKGDLVIVGGGDPTLGSPRFRTDPFDHWVVDQLKQKGVKSVDGNILLDASRYESNHPHNWIWGDIGNYYGAGSYGINYIDNTYNLYFKSGAAGTQTKITSVEPDLGLLKINNDVEAARISSDQAYIFGQAFNHTKTIQGQIPQYRTDFKVRGAIPDPALWLGTILGNTLNNHDIVWKGKVLPYYKTSVGEFRMLGKYSSPPLQTIVRVTNMVSMNLYAETMAKEIALSLGMQQPNTEEAANKIEQFWKSEGIDIDGLKLSDGSGLSRNNLITPEQLAGILIKMYNSKNKDAYMESLPVSGKSGTMRRMGAGTVAEGRVMAKSGYINGIRTYSGYITTVSGRHLAFVVMANNFTCSAHQMKKKIEKLMIEMAGL